MRRSLLNADPLDRSIRCNDRQRTLEEWRVGKIGEGLAALGVIVSLLFVGYEIRQNTQLSKAASLEAQAELGAEIALNFLADAEVVQFLTRIADGELPSDFEKHENTKIRLMYVALLRSAEIRYRHKDLGVLDDTSVLGGSGNTLRAPYLAANWDQLKLVVSPDFALRFEADYGLR
jgi:hypothetical protein